MRTTLNSRHWLKIFWSWNNFNLFQKSIKESRSIVFCLWFLYHVKKLKEFYFRLTTKKFLTLFSMKTKRLLFLKINHLKNIPTPLKLSLISTLTLQLKNKNRENMIPSIFLKNWRTLLKLVKTTIGRLGNTKLNNIERNLKNQNKNCLMKLTEEKCNKKKNEKDLRLRTLPKNSRLWESLKKRKRFSELKKLSLTISRILNSQESSV